MIKFTNEPAAIVVGAFRIVWPVFAFNVNAVIAVLVLMLTICPRNVVAGIVSVMLARVPPGVIT